MAGKKVVQIFGDEYDVRSEVKVIRSMSAHGDADDLLKFLSCQDPEHVKKIFLVHGEEHVQKIFRGKLQDAGFADIMIPEQHQTVDI